MRLTNRLLLLTCFAATLSHALDQNDLFDGSVLHEIRLTVNPVDWKNLRDHFLENTYYPASLEWKGMIIEDVGIRSRGLGSRSYDKPGLKLDFNRYSQGQNFLGLKSLILDNAAQDRTMFAERLSMEMFRRLGLPAPRLVHTRLYINGSYAGLYVIMEPVDKVFLQRNLGENSGYLYDYEWVYDYWFDFLGDEPGHYTPEPFQPQTNEKNPQPGPLVDMIRTINQSSDEEFRAAVSQYLDLERVAKYLAVETFVGEFDGLAGDWGANNFYLYRFNDSNRFEFIPWDKDVTFQEPHAERSIWANFDRHVLIRRMMALPDIRERYLAALNECIRTAGGAGGWLEQEIERIYQQVRTAALDDPQKNETNAEFEEGVSSLKTFAFARPRFIRAQMEEAVVSNSSGTH